MGYFSPDLPVVAHAPVLVDLADWELLLARAQARPASAARDALLIATAIELGKAMRDLELEVNYV